MAELAVRGPLAESDLRDELRFHPVRAFPREAELAGDRRRLALQRLQLSEEHVEVLALETGADLAAVLECAVLVVRDEERAEILPASRGVGPSDDDDLLVEDALELQPVPRPRADVGRGEALRDQAFPSAFASGPERDLALLLHVIGVLERPFERERVVEHLL